MWELAGGKTLSCSVTFSRILRIQKGGGFKPVLLCSTFGCVECLEAYRMRSKWATCKGKRAEPGERNQEIRRRLKRTRNEEQRLKNSLAAIQKRAPLVILKQSQLIPKTGKINDPSRREPVRGPKKRQKERTHLEFDATLDVMSSAIVIWRYSNAAAVHSAHREYIACVILGIVFILSSLCILGKAIHDLATRMPPEVDDFLYSVSIVSGLSCAVLAVAKFMLGKKLTSRALITDGFNSMVGAIMGFSILISAEVFKHHPDVWFLDGTIGVLIGLIILAYGVKLLKDMVPR
ncbi:hypothetical protein CCH79_00002979, partial [Gambusia affinis]